MEMKYFFYRNDGILNRIDLDMIYLLESAGNYVKLVWQGPTITIRGPLDAIEKMLPSTQFARIHRAYLVSIGKVTIIKRDSVILFTDPPIELPMTKGYVPGLLKSINILGTADKKDYPPPRGEG
jgi:two-component system LytT family response regulator